MTEIMDKNTDADYVNPLLMIIAMVAGTGILALLSSQSKKKTEVKSQQ